MFLDVNKEFVMANAAFELFEDLRTYMRLRQMIDDGETEGLHLECKSPAVPRLTSMGSDTVVPSARETTGTS